MQPKRVGRRIAEAVKGQFRALDISDAVAIPGGRSFNPAAPTGPLGVGAVDPVAVVLGGPVVKLGGSTAAEQVMKGTTFEVDFLVWLNGFTALLTALATPGAPITYIAAVVAAAVLFQPIHSAFVAQVSGGIHRSLKIFTQ